jgi:glycosyl transferase family 87
MALKPVVLLVVYIGLALLTAIQLYLMGTHTYVIPIDLQPGDMINHAEKLNQFIGRQHTDYNNYVIFKYSFFHLLSGSNLYGLHPQDHWDYYKYSPSFAALMGMLAYLPDVVGLSLWNIFNAAALFLAIRLMPFNTKTQSLLMWFVVVDMVTSMQNAQSNGLMCGLMVAGYGCLHHNKLIWAALWIVLATYIKVYGAIAFCMFLFYPGKLKFIIYALLWTVILGAIPLLFTPWHTLLWQYQNWLELMKADATSSVGLSVASWLETWFGFKPGMAAITLTGLAIFLIPFARFRLYSNEVYKLLILASMLIWVIIFNHKAESPTYVIAVAGVGIWYFAMPKVGWRSAVLLFVFVFTSLCVTDLFPPYVRLHFIYPYKIKAFPCILAWCIIVVELLRLKRPRLPNETESPGDVGARLAKA